MKYKFNDYKDDTHQNYYFEYHEVMPKTKRNYNFNVNALIYYGLYRNAVYSAYRQNKNVASDILNAPLNAYDEKSQSLKQKEEYQSPIYHYAVKASKATMEEWLDPNEKMQSYLLKDETSDIKNCGFVNFQEKTMNGKQVVYIAQMGVSSPGEGLGRRLMECVLNHYPVGTEFYILTRVFNTHAINLYEKRFKFESLEKSEIKALGYNDERYCGFKHTTTTQELAEIASKQVKLELSDSSLEIKKRKLTQRSG